MRRRRQHSRCWGLQCTSSSITSSTSTSSTGSRGACQKCCRCGSGVSLVPTLQAHTDRVRTAVAWQSYRTAQADRHSATHPCNTTNAAAALHARPALLRMVLVLVLVLILVLVCVLILVLVLALLLLCVRRVPRLWRVPVARGRAHRAPHRRTGRRRRNPAARQRQQRRGRGSSSGGRGRRRGRARARQGASCRGCAWRGQAPGRG
jgi:hypothetical protein